MAERGAAVAVAHIFRFVLDLKRFFGLRGVHQREGRLVVRIHALADAAGIEAAEFVVHQGEQRTAAVHARPIHAHGQIEVAHLVAIGVRISGVERIVLGAEKSGFLPASGYRGNRNRRRQVSARPEFLRDHRLHGRELDGAQRLVPAANQRESRFVRDQLVRHRADDHEFVGLRRRHRQVLGDADARHIGFDGLELAAILGVGVGLGIPAIHLADAAAEQ